MPHPRYVWDPKQGKYAIDGAPGAFISSDGALAQSGRSAGAEIIGGPAIPKELQDPEVTVSRAARGPEMDLSTLIGKVGPILQNRGVPGIPGQMLSKTMMGAALQPGSAPDPEAEGLAEVDAARGEADRRRLSANIGRAGDTISSAISGAPSQGAYWDKLGANSGRDVEFAQDKLTATRNLLARREAQKRQADEAKATADYRAQNLGLRQREVAARERSAGQPKGLSPELAYRMGRDQQEDQRKTQERGDKLAREDAERSVPGFTAQGPVSADSAKKLRDSLAAAERMKGYVSQLRALHHQYGTEYGGAAGTAMEQLARKIELEAKNIGELGAISGPDLGLIKSISQADPGSLTANLKGLVSGGKWDNTASALDGLDSWVNDTLGANAKAYGFTPNAAPSPKAAAPEDNEAVQWARDNPRDPRSAAILAANGVK